MRRIHFPTISCIYISLKLGTSSVEYIIEPAQQSTHHFEAYSIPLQSQHSVSVTKYKSLLKAANQALNKGIIVIGYWSLVLSYLTKCAYHGRENNWDTHPVHLPFSQLQSNQRKQCHYTSS